MENKNLSNLSNRSLLQHISVIPDPRMEGKCDHKLVDIIAIVLPFVSGTLSGIRFQVDYNYSTVSH